MWEWCWKNRSRLTNLIDDVWQWERIETDLQYEKLGRMDTLHAAARGSCVCEGKWVATVVASFLANGIDIKELCKDVLHLLRVGRSPDTPVLALAGAFGNQIKAIRKREAEAQKPDGASIKWGCRLRRSASRWSTSRPHLRVSRTIRT